MAAIAFSGRFLKHLVGIFQSKRTIAAISPRPLRLEKAQRAARAGLEPGMLLLSRLLDPRGMATGTQALDAVKLKKKCGCCHCFLKKIPAGMFLPLICCNMSSCRNEVQVRLQRSAGSCR